MTKVIFYTEVRNKETFIYQFLRRKVFMAQTSALVFGSEEQIVRLDEALWEGDGFLPHERMRIDGEGENSAPILLTSTAPSPALGAEMLLSVADELPDFVGRFSFYVDVIGASESDKHAARARYKYLKDHGYAIDVHRMSGR